MDTIFHRVSIRKFEDRPVEDEKIEQLFRAAMAAPSAQNQQPWEFYAVRSRPVIEALSRCSPYAGFAASAPLVVVCCMRKETRCPRFREIDLSASTQNLLLEADALGLGATWIGVAPLEERMADVARVLSMPQHLEPFAMVACGYPAESRAQQQRYDAARVHFV